MNIMSSLTYRKMLFENDADVPRLAEIYQEPEIARYLSISDNYFHYEKEPFASPFFPFPYKKTDPPAAMAVWVCFSRGEIRL